MDGELIAYGDLNCPFCYVLEQWLGELGASERITWRLVEHAPQIPDGPDAAQPELLAELAEEMDRIADRAPDAGLKKPDYRPNSREAIRAVAQVQTIDAVAAGRLRAALFRAIWSDGLDVSDSTVIEMCATKAGIPHVPSTPSAGDDVVAWKQAWEGGAYDRIPVIVAPQGTTLLGLGTRRRLELFLRSGLFSSISDDAC